MGFGELEESPTEAMQQILVPFLEARGGPAHQIFLMGIARLEATAETVCAELNVTRRLSPAAASAAIESESESESSGGKRARF